MTQQLNVKQSHNEFIFNVPKNLNTTKLVLYAVVVTVLGMYIYLYIVFLMILSFFLFLTDL